MSLSGSPTVRGLSSARRFLRNSPSSLRGILLVMLPSMTPKAPGKAGRFSSQDESLPGWVSPLFAHATAAAAAWGPIEILQYSPVPRADFMKPVLDTGADDLDAPLSFSVKGPVTAVNAVLPGMRELGRGTLLFVNGGSAVRPHPDRAGTSIAFAAESAYARMLHDALAPQNIHAAQLIIPGAIRPDAEHSSPDALAQRLYAIHRERDGFRHYAEPLPD
ncbi:dehydrogenase [Streptomyces sp. WM6386]|nr:dehydrogenase [Streptomyces sp. WM6386]